MSRLLRPVVWALAIAVAIPSAWAADRVVDASGAVHRVDVDSWTQSGTTATGSVLRHVVTYPDGTVVKTAIPETADPALDRDPTLDLDPVTESPVVAWSRNDGGGFRVMVSRLVGGAWSPAVTVGSGGGVDHVRPMLRARKNLVHVVWRADGPGGPVRLRASLDRAGLTLAFGPEVLPLDLDGMVPHGGGSGLPTDDASWGMTYFASEVPGPAGSPDGGSVVVWGIRDEPIPITYHQAFATPSEVRSMRELGATWRAGTLFTWIVSGSTFYYSLHETDQWTEFRPIALEAGTDGAEGLRLVEAMLRRVREGNAPD